MTTVYVDADACPVKDEIITIAIRHGCRAVMVCNGGIRPHPHPLIDLAIVDDGPDAADMWIAREAGAELGGQWHGERRGGEQPCDGDEG